MPVDREAIRSNAKYLRQVRPIDPTEIADYVPDQPDPRVVAQVLREEAFDLGLAELSDGTFVPAASGTYNPSFRGVEAFPTAYETVLEDLLMERYGPDWDDGDTANAIRDRIDRLKADYYRGRRVGYDEDVALAYALYHLPDYYASTQYVLADLARDGELPSRLRILDVGAGVGGPALGVNDFYARAGEAAADEDAPPIVDYVGVEPSDAATVLESMLGVTDRNLHWTVERDRAEEYEPAGPFDVVLFSNVVSELEDPVEVVEPYFEALADAGTLILTAPADRETSIHLREVERTLEDRGATVFGPTVRLWPGKRPSEECWSFDRRPDIAVPTFQERLAAGAGRPDAVRNTSIKFSYSFLRTDGQRRYDIELDRSQVAAMGEMETHVSNRLDVVAAKLSQNLAEEGHPLFKVSDGSEQMNHFAVQVAETSLNEALTRAGYGDLLSFENVLVLWNDDEDAYNLVVDEETIVDPLS